MPTLRIRFVSHDGFISGAIRAAQLGWPYVHVDAAVDGGYLGAHAIGGVRLRPIGYDASRLLIERFYEIQVDDDTAGAYLGHLRAQLGKPYDHAAIADFAGELLAKHVCHEGDWRDPTRWFCSELVVAALIHAGVFPHALAADARRVTPQNLAFALSGRLDVVVRAA